MYKCIICNNDIVVCPGCVESTNYNIEKQKNIINMINELFELSIENKEIIAKHGFGYMFRKVKK